VIMGLTDMDIGPRLPDMEPVRKYVVLVLWHGQQDRAAELVVGGPVANGSVPIRYLVDGNWYEISPFPAHIREQVVQVVLELAGQQGAVQFPWEGEIDEEVTESVHLRWAVQLAAPGTAVYFRSSDRE